MSKVKIKILGKNDLIDQSWSKSHNGVRGRYLRARTSDLPSVGDIIEQETESGNVSQYKIVGLAVSLKGKDDRYRIIAEAELLKVKRPFSSHLPNEPFIRYENINLTVSSIRKVWSILSSTKRPLSIRDITDMTGISTPSRTHAIIKVLEERGYIRVGKKGGARTVHVVIPLVDGNVSDGIAKPKFAEDDV